mmetsp:Transcript_10778/g.13636  ORF Transcript_10778/g.13636 Transcript_10778/m.13636 type:complete len:652 (+) Transcript_10778:94-2049(+)
MISWSNLPPMKYSRYRFATAVVNGNIYVMGGTSTGDDTAPAQKRRNILSSVEMYNPETQTWEELPPMRKGRSGHACAAVKNKIYVFGGNLSGEVPSHNNSNCGEVFDLDSNTWTALSNNMVKKKSHHAAVAIGHKIYVLGGHRTNKSEVYDTITGEWNAIRPMITKKYAYAAVVIGDLIYTMGGRLCEGAKHDYEKFLCTMEIYNTETNTWSYSTSDTNMNYRRAGCSAIQTMGSNIMVFGGMTDTHFVQEVEIFRIEESKWKVLSVPISVPREGLCAVKVDKQNMSELILLGGKHASIVGRNGTAGILKSVEVCQIPNEISHDLIKQVQREQPKEEYPSTKSNNSSTKVSTSTTYETCTTEKKKIEEKTRKRKRGQASSGPKKYSKPAQQSAAQGKQDMPGETPTSRGHTYLSCKIAKRFDDKKIDYATVVKCVYESNSNSTDTRTASWSWKVHWEDSDEESKLGFEELKESLELYKRCNEAGAPSTRSKTTIPSLPSPPPNGKTHLWQMIASEFDNEIFYGTVRKCACQLDKNGQVSWYWKVIYEDGEEFKLPFEGIKEGLDLFKKDPPTTNISINTTNHYNHNQVSSSTSSTSSRVLQNMTSSSLSEIEDEIHAKIDRVSKLEELAFGEIQSGSLSKRIADLKLIARC